MNDGALERPWSGQHAWDSRAGGGGAQSCDSLALASLFSWPSTQTLTCTAAATPPPDPEHTAQNL